MTNTTIETRVVVAMTTIAGETTTAEVATTTGAIEARLVAAGLEEGAEEVDKTTIDHRVETMAEIEKKGDST